MPRRDSGGNPFAFALGVLDHSCAYKKYLREATRLKRPRLSLPVLTYPRPGFGLLNRQSVCLDYQWVPITGR